MKTLKKFNVRNVSDKISDNQLKKVIGGGYSCYGLSCSECEYCWCTNESTTWFQCKGANNGWICAPGGEVRCNSY